MKKELKAILDKINTEKLFSGDTSIKYTLDILEAIVLYLDKEIKK